MVRLGIESHVIGGNMWKFLHSKQWQKSYLILKYQICLKIILKPVFIIAIVAVAMIGVMVPSVFAEEIDAKWVDAILRNPDITDEEILDAFEYLVNLDYYVNLRMSNYNAIQNLYLRFKI